MLLLAALLTGPTVTFDPPAARPGDSVMVRIAVPLPPGTHTYPTRQPDPAAAGFVSRVEFPADSTFVGETLDPPTRVIADPELGGTGLHTIRGTAVFARRLLVPNRPGPLAIVVSARLVVCDTSHCRSLAVRATGNLAVLP
jgi:hypothetical protein